MNQEEIRDSAFAYHPCYVKTEAELQGDAGRVLVQFQ